MANAKEVDLIRHLDVVLGNTGKEGGPRGLTEDLTFTRQ